MSRRKNPGTKNRVTLGCARKSTHPRVAESAYRQSNVKRRSAEQCQVGRPAREDEAERAELQRRSSALPIKKSSSYMDIFFVLAIRRRNCFLLYESAGPSRANRCDAAMYAMTASLIASNDAAGMALVSVPSKTSTVGTATCARTVESIVERSAT